MREESLQSNAQELELNRTLFEDCPSSASAVLETRAWLEGSYDLSPAFSLPVPQPQRPTTLPQRRHTLRLTACAHTGPLAYITLITCFFLATSIPLENLLYPFISLSTSPSHHGLV